LDPLCDFHFAIDEDQVVWLAAVLTVLVRSAINGPCPLFSFTASTPGIGKSLLADGISVIATGRRMPRTVAPETDEELRKRLTAVAISGDIMVLFDNVVGAFGAPSLDAALTGTRWSDRILGKSEVVELPLRAVWFLTANNLQLKGDVRRRVVPCQLQTNLERPEERSDFRYPKLLEHIHSHRAELAVAGLTILRAYDVAGRPDQELPTFGSFESWSDLIRSAVHWATDGLDPCVTRHRLREADPALATHAALLEGWSELPGQGSGLSVGEALRFLGDTSNEDKFSALRTALMDLSKTDRLPCPSTIGLKMRMYRDRVVNGMVLKGEMGHGSVQRWRVERTNDSAEEVIL
jgi:hypothetical protein